MELSIIIPTKDRGEVFYHTLTCAIESTLHMDAEIIVVNDSRKTQLTIPNNQRVRLIINPKSGVAAARNIGVKNSTGELLLFLDDDIVISKDSIDHMVKLHQEKENACFNVNWEYPMALQERLQRLQFGRFLKTHGFTSFKGWYDDPSWVDNALFPSRSIASFHLSIKRTDFDKTDGYNEQFPHAGFEDYDFPLQLKKAGIAFFIDTTIKVYHNEADRLNLENWLNSQERRAATRKVAVELGYAELTIDYGFIKSGVLRIVNFLYMPLMGLLKSIPNRALLDSIYFKIVAVLQAGKIFKGYTTE